MSHRKHIPYGLFKRGGSKIHPHNKCEVCSENTIIKKKARRRAKEEILKELLEL